jgi:trehalose-6-phosphatase
MRPFCFSLGDDATDEDAFEACADGITIRVGAPEGSAAKYHLADPGEVLIFLEWLTDQLRVDKPSIAT